MLALDDAVERYRERVQKRLDAKAVERYRNRRDARLYVRMDDEEEEPNNKKGGGSGGGRKGGGGGRGNTRLPFGLCQRFGIQIGKDWGPSEAWDALAEKGITPKGAFDRLKRGKDPGDPGSDEDYVDVSGLAAIIKKAGPDGAIKVYKEQRDKFNQLQKDYDSKRKEVEDFDYYQKRLAEKEVRRAEERLADVEEKEKLINGRDGIELGAAVQKAEEEYRWWQKEYKRLYSRPERGTPEREEWDAWIERNGGFENYAERVTKEVTSDDGAYGRYVKEQTARSAYMDFKYYGGREQAEKSLKEKREKLDAVTKESEKLHGEEAALKRDVESSRASLEKEREIYAQAIKSKFPTYRDCKTTEDVVDRMDCEGYFKENQQPWLSALPLGGAIRVAEEVDSFFAKNPLMKGKLGAVRVGKLSGHVYGQAGGYVYLNEFWYGDREKFEESYNHSTDIGFHPAGTTYRSVTTHEYTHLMDTYLSKELGLGTDGYGKQKMFSTVVFTEVRKNLKMSAEECKKAVSLYAFKNKSGGAKEFLAEAYAEFLDSPSPRPVAAEVGKVVQRYMKELEAKKK